MRRWVAIVLLVVVATFLAVSGADRCHEQETSPHGIQGQHLLCIDDCTPALVPDAVQAPPADALPRLVYEEAMRHPILSLELEPEKEPPRA